MDIRDRRGLKQASAQALADAAYDPKKLMLIHTGVSLAVSLLVALCSHFLSLAIDNTGGLGGIGQRSILSTTQSCLELAHLLVVPFWQFGMLTVTVRLIRRQEAVPATLLTGFRMFFGLLRLIFLQAMLVLGITVAASYLGSMLYLFTPWSADLVELVYNSPELSDALLATLPLETTVPMFLCVFAAIAVLVVPYLYRLRLSQYLLLDSQEKKAMQAIRISRGLMRRKCFTLFKLDMSFWWFYALEVLVGFVCYADVLLPACGIALPFSSTVAYFGFYILSAFLQLGLYYWKGMHIQTTYAAFYEAVIQPEEYGA